MECNQDLQGQLMWGKEKNFDTKKNLIKILNVTVIFEEFEEIKALFV